MRQLPKMIDFNSIRRVALPLQFVGVGKLKTTLTATAAAIAIAAALLGGSLHSQAHADSPTSTGNTRASQPHGDASQTLRRYTLLLLHILSNPDANQWERYRQAMQRCADAPAYLDEINAGSEAGPLTLALIALTEDLCGGLERRLDEARTVGLLVNEPESLSGYVLLTGRFNNYVHLIDHLGRIAHSWQFEVQTPHAKLLDNGNLLVQIGNSGWPGHNISEVDPDGNIMWKYTHPDSLHHDFLKMPNGNVLMLTQGTLTREEVIAAGVNPTVVHFNRMRYDYLIEVRPTGSEDGEIVWEWSAWDYIVQNFDPTKPNYGDPSEHPERIDVNFLVETPRLTPSGTWDWLHTNAIDYNTELDQIVLSPRHFGELWMIDHSAATEEAVARSSANPEIPPPVQMC